MSWVYLLLGSLLPLGLVLLGSRVNSPRLVEGEEARVATWQVTLGAALCFATPCFRLIQLLPHALLRYDEPWLYDLYLSGMALPAAPLSSAVCMRLSARLQRFAAGCTLLLAVVAMLLWNMALLAVGGGLVLLMIFGLAPAGIDYTLLVALLGVSLLTLLWPTGRLATRWCYADQLVA